MFDDTKIIKVLDGKKLFQKIKKYGENEIECTNHTFFRLNQKQREIFSCDKLKQILLTQMPFLAGIQSNGNHVLFYKCLEKNLKIILAINRKINIVTFYFIEEWQIPKI